MASFKTTADTATATEIPTKTAGRIVYAGNDTYENSESLKKGRNWYDAVNAIRDKIKGKDLT